MPEKLTSLSSTTTLNNGVKMPWVGLGVYMSSPGASTQGAVEAALAAGYRHVDTARVHPPEKSGGAAIPSGGPTGVAVTMRDNGGPILQKVRRP